MAQNFWENDPVVEAPQRQPGIRQIVAPQPDRPPAQTPTQQALTEEQLRAAVLENRRRERGEAAGPTAEATEAERTAAFLAARVAGGINDLQGILRDSPDAEAPELDAAFAGLFGPTARNLLNSSGRQRVEAAQLDILDAALTLGTGAAYTREQLEGYRQSYFPQIGDSAETIADKQNRLLRLLQSARVKAGRAAPDIDRALAALGQTAAPQQQVPPEPQRQQEAVPGRASVDILLGTPEEQEADFRRRLAENGEVFLGYRDGPDGPVAMYGPPPVRSGGQEQRDRLFIESALQNIGPAGPLYQAAESILGQEGGDAFRRGFQDIPTIGLSDEVRAGIETVLGDGTMGENLAEQRAVQAYDERENLGERLSGQVIGGFTIPTGVTNAARTAAVSALRSGATREAALAAARQAAVRRMTYEGATFGGAYGAGSSDGDIIDRVAEGAVSAAIGGTAGNLAGRVGARLTGGGARRPSGAGDDQLEATQAAAELGIEMPRFVAGGATAQRLGSAAEQTPFGSPVISRATEGFIEQSQGARDRIASSVGNVLEPEGAGQVALDAARNWRTGTSREGRALYTAAQREAGDTFVTPQNTMQTLSRIIREEREVPGGTQALPVIERYAQAFENGGSITIEGARKMRTELRQRLGETMTPSNAERLTGQIMDSVGQDIEQSLRAAGQEGAVAAYRRADEFWARRMSFIEDNLRPIVGRNGDNTPEQVARALTTDARTNGTRLGVMLRDLPQDAANTIRATLISRLGRSTDGAQDATGEAFSLDTFLTNWNQIRGAREQIFDRETVRSLNRLAIVANRAKAAGRTRNRSNTGTVMSAMVTGAPATGGVASLSPSAAVMGLIGSALAAFGQFQGARMLASPRFAARLAATPDTPQGAAAYWSRPWVAQLARSEPAIASEVLQFQQAITRQLSRDARPLAAQSREDQQDGADRQQSGPAPREERRQ